ncbi:phosphatase PAP2 family protein [Tenacibaculum maritimum]|uniref:phosphatase PAP2 family protein n=1 Tax=Tenacibaculum maritimum TaxID=107401 RepID=UPI0012E5CCD8|nr:phosphatase PAP2 family protein [Tenacibaculum maritimum]MCD9583042.1 phosphatase PAP2 family protein [Tenacibaculum maritimum]MCD9636998.1 phosphatase PAP2 family protein [Tenacibaculum maritimum]CAA0223967.1 putative membrane-associated phospholipid phosphatase [Tenacibaculum maritimum]
MCNSPSLNESVVRNFNKITYRLLLFPFALLCLLSIFLIASSNDSNYANHYMYFQKEAFLYLNNKLATFPDIAFNTTQLGDVLISFPLLTIFIIYAPKLWEALFTASLLSLVISASFKKLFSIPRPAAVFDHDSFVILGETLTGSTSFPSGHSIATFVVITVLLFAFMPQKNSTKLLWSISLIALGLFIASSRVAVGAHYPFDVVVGSILGYMIAIIGIKLNAEINGFIWIKNRRYYPFFMLIFIILMFLIGHKIIKNNIPIYYISFLSLTISLYTITSSYVKKKN